MQPGNVSRLNGAHNCWGKNQAEREFKDESKRKLNFTAQMASVLTLPPLFYVLVDGSYSKIQIGLEPGASRLGFLVLALEVLPGLDLRFKNQETERQKL